MENENRKRGKINGKKIQPTSGEKFAKQSKSREFATGRLTVQIFLISRSDFFYLNLLCDWRRR